MLRGCHRSASRYRALWADHQQRNVEQRLGQRSLVTEEMMLAEVLPVVPDHYEDGFAVGSISDAMSPRRLSRYETPPR